MKRMVIVLAAAVLSTACKDKKSEPASPPTGSAPAAKGASCAEQTAELEPWIRGLLEGKPTTAPWPTGDATFDAELPKLREEARELRKPADPAAPRPQLVEGVTPGPLDKELAGCEPAVAQIKSISEGNPANASAGWAGLAGAIAACDCKPNIARVKALLYLMHRGPD